MIPLGIDIGSETISAALILESQTYSLEIQNNESGFKQFQTWLETRVSLLEVHATMEATSVYWKAILDHKTHLTGMVARCFPSRVVRSSQCGQPNADQEFRSEQTLTR
jgi:hypothetical protein